MELSDRRNRTPVWPFILGGALMLPVLACGGCLALMGIAGKAVHEVREQEREQKKEQAELDRQTWVVSAANLLADFERNNFYQGKEVIFRGNVIDWNDSIVQLQNANLLKPNLYCHFDKDCPPVRKGDDVILRGKCTGEGFLETVHVEHCQVVYGPGVKGYGERANVNYRTLTDNLWRELIANPAYNH